MNGSRFVLAVLAPLLLAAGEDEASFAPCGSGPRITCVVDGDTLWFEGTKIRLADINTPETFQPRCAEERALGKAATARLIVLLNSGPVRFGRAPGERDEDRYGRKLRIASRGGASLGETLVAEGLAERWKGRRSDWCSSRT